MHQRSAAIEGRAHRPASAGGIKPTTIKSLGPAAWGQSVLTRIKKRAPSNLVKAQSCCWGILQKKLNKMISCKLARRSAHVNKM